MDKREGLGLVLIAIPIETFVFVMGGLEAVVVITLALGFIGVGMYLISTGGS